MHSVSEPAAARTTLPGLLRHVYWIGGGSGSGKSTIARRIAVHYGMQLYDTDAVMPDHARRRCRRDRRPPTPPTSLGGWQLEFFDLLVGPSNAGESGRGRLGQV
jgi:hypothetical protein